jgi:NADPH-dependent ferric siderophore reductase
MPTEYLTAELVRRAQLTPTMVRLTFSVPGFRGTGMADEWVHVFLGEPGDHRNRRNYTIRAIRGEEIDVDVVLHERGLMVDWVATAEPGATLVWGDVTGSYGPPADTVWRLLAGDITALPAIGRIVEELPAGARATVLAEVEAEADRQAWDTAGDVRVVWLRPGLLDGAVRTFPEPAGEGYRWMAAETRVVRMVRRHLRHERGIPRERYSLTGYWLDRFEEWEARYLTVAQEMSAIWSRGEAEGRDEEEIMDEYEAALERVGL